jgi:integrase
MARTVQDAKIGSREARSKLPARRKPFWRQIQQGLHLGYRKPRGRRGKPAGAGMWIMRAYVDGAYREKAIVAADDFAAADGTVVLNFAQAQAKVLELAVRGADSGIGSGPLTVAGAVALHLEHLEGQGQSVVNQRYHASAHIIPALGAELVADLTTKRLQKWLHDLARQEPRVRTLPGEKQQHRVIDTDDAEAVRRRRSSANRIWNTLRAALNHAWQQGLVSSDSVWRRIRVFKDVEHARVRFLSIAESQRLINGADAEFRPLVIAALQTGARYQELARLKVADFNQDACTLAIWVSKSGKPRHVVLNDEGSGFFRQLCAGRNPGELMLPRSDGTQWGRSHQQLKMLAACKRAKIEPAIGFHVLRHTWASLSVMADMPLMIIAKNLGHSSTRMVEKHYGHLAPSYVADEIREKAPRFGISKSNVASIR